MSQIFKTTVEPNGVAELKFDLPNEKINKFSLPVLNDLEQEIDRLAKNPNIKILKLTSGKENIFIAGADLHGFEPAFEDPSIAKTIIQTGHRVLDKLAKLPFPTIAVINGACLGGGLECALSCTYRVVTDNPKTQLALPEVNLGIFPGWGGTQRLPRLVGLTEGLNMILTGKSIPGMKAYKIGLADAIVPYEFVDEKVTQFVASVLTDSGKKAVLARRSKKPLSNRLMDDNPIGRAIVFKKAESTVKEKTKGHYPAPLIALDVVKKSYTLPLEEGLKVEVDGFLSNIPDGLHQARELIPLFFTQEALKKETGVPANIKPKEIRSAAVLGAGTMGASIAWLFADHNIFTRLKDLSWDVLGKGMSVIRGLFAKGLKARKITRSEFDRRFQLVSNTTDYSGFQHADFVLEAATENLELKKKIYQELEKVVSEKTIIASNTSSLTIESMADSLKHPERFIGMHFFNPVNKLPLVEIAPGKKTSPETLATVVDLAKKLGKTPVIVGDCPGFLVNRILIPGANEMILMYEEGYTKESLSKATASFGMPMEPFELADEIGIDVTYKVGDVFEKGYGERMRPPKLLKLMVDKGLLGKKVNKGFYLYKKDQKEGFNPEIEPLRESVHRTTASHPEEEILPRFLYSMINEAARCLEEKIVQRPDYLDMALIMGIGFPPFQGGLLRYADKVGAKQIVDTLKKLSREHGARFEPCKLLVKMSETGKTFY